MQVINELIKYSSGRVALAGKDIDDTRVWDGFLIVAKTVGPKLPRNTTLYPSSSFLFSFLLLFFPISLPFFCNPTSTSYFFLLCLTLMTFIPIKFAYVDEDLGHDPKREELSGSNPSSTFSSIILLPFFSLFSFYSLFPLFANYYINFSTCSDTLRYVKFRCVSKTRAEQISSSSLFSTVLLLFLSFLVLPFLLFSSSFLFLFLFFDKSKDWFLFKRIGSSGSEDAHVYWKCERRGSGNSLL